MRGLPYSAMGKDAEDDLGRPSGEGFVELPFEVDDIATMAKHRYHMGHRNIELLWSSPEELMRAL